MQLYEQVMRLADYNNNYKNHLSKELGTNIGHACFRKQIAKHVHIMPILNLPT